MSKLVRLYTLEGLNLYAILHVIHALSSLWKIYITAQAISRISSSYDWVTMRFMYQLLYITLTTQ